MVKSSLKIKRVISNKSHKHHNKQTLREIIENKIHKYSKKTHQQYISRIRLFEELHKTHKNRTSNQIKFYLRKTLIKLLEVRVLIKHRDSYRFSKVYLNKQVKKLKKLKEKQKKKQELNNKKQNKTKLTNKKSIKAKVVDILSNSSNAISQAINDIKSKINQKILDNPNNKSLVIKDDSKGKSTTQQINKSIKKAYKRIHPAIWEYHDANKATSNPSPDGWYEYDPEASDIVEDAWQRYIVNRGLNDVRSVTSGEWQYMVDFMNWKQTNTIHSAHTQRNIRRLDEKGNITRNPYQ